VTKKEKKEDDKLTIKVAIDTLEKQINEHQVILLKKQGALEVLKQVKS